jgi:hypothetical protein
MEIDMQIQTREMEEKKRESKIMSVSFQVQRNDKMRRTSLDLSVVNEHVH